ncbi:ABC transporter permease [Gordonia sp. zg691]|uniref:Transport permease protein n=1 Tax=Gordonia jinghuaiqii TaxID=2758710 RepID=A0A7D7LS59_9ACTN|nr:ABC transporter permease [Gordonia jinghuaiqii]MBD0863315.1 ABC transporter permease [Gordonia jinghuaiqii]MCR5980173.1 ABC transporter permease [Gordonia jinghuaiqii]QMT02065.1 ABC transporter permease [Gordonia jinghuaiqii]
MSTTLAHTLSDSSVMVRRNLIRLRRYPTMMFSTIAMPVVILLMMTFFFGGAIESALAAGGPLDGKYINYLLPGLLLFVPSFLTVAVAVAVNQDVTEGIVNRLRSLATPPTAILAGHFVGALIQGAVAVLVLLGAAFALGFRSDAGGLDWLLAGGLLLLLTAGLVWIAVAMGVVAPNPESASNMPLPLLFLPYLGSGLVPTDSMPDGVRQFAEYQPFSPIADTLRGLLMGLDISGRWPWAVGWCVVFLVVGYLWAVTAFRRSTTG